MAIAAPRPGPYSMMVLDGVDDYVRRSGGDMTTALMGSKGVTAACWCYIPAIPAVGGFDTIMQVSSGGVGGVTLTASNFSNSPGIYAESRSQAESVVTTSRSSGALNLRSWALVTNVTNYDAGTVELYKNDQRLASASGVFSFPYFNPASQINSHIFGAFNTGGGGWLEGWIGDAWIYPRALTADEVAKLYLGVVAASPTAWLIPDAENARMTDIVGGYHTNTNGGGATLFRPGGPWV